MKKHITTFFGVQRLGMAGALLVFFAFTVALRADYPSFAIVNDTANYKVGGSKAGNTNSFKAESFDTGNFIGSPISFDTIHITLGLDFISVNSANVYLYSANATTGQPAASGTWIGTVSGTGYGLDTVTFNSTGLGLTLSANTDYAIVLDTSGTGGASAMGGAVAWEYATYDSIPAPTTSGTGTFFDPGAWDYGAKKSSWSNTANGVTDQLRIMEVYVPEPGTQTVLIFGSVVLLVSASLRRWRRSRPVV